MATISRDTPLMEITIRRYEKPDSMNKRELVRKFCLSMGLLQPGDSRDVVVDVLYVLLEARKDRNNLTSEQIRELTIETRKNHELALNGIASSNIRRQIKRLRDIFLVEKMRNSYRITEFSNLNDVYREKIEQFVIPPIMNRVTDYFRKIDIDF